MPALASVTLHQGWCGVPNPESELSHGLKSDGLVRPRHRPGVVLFEHGGSDRRAFRLGGLAPLLREAAYRTHRISVTRVDHETYFMGSEMDHPAQRADHVSRPWADFLARFDRHTQSLGADWVVDGGVARRMPASIIEEVPTQDLSSTLEARLYADVRSYFHLGEHRTGTDTDRLTQAWVAQRMQAQGYAVTQQDWHVLQFFPDDVRVIYGDLNIDAWSLWTPSPSQRLSAPLVTVETLDDAGQAKDSIALVEVLDGDRWRIPDYDRVLFDVGAVGAIYVTGRGSTGYLYAENASANSVNRIRELPAVVIGCRGRDRLLHHYRPGEPAGLWVEGALAPDTRSSNIIATLDRGGPGIVISTPSSGWFRAGGERGSGLALWFALSNWAVSKDFPVSFMFVANSGHELDFYGAERLFESGVLPAPEQTLAWLHLGASIGTPAWHQDGAILRRDPGISGGNLLSVERFLPQLARSFAAIDALQPQPHRAIGELGRVVAKGYPGFGLVGGGNIWSHSHADTPESVSAETLAEVATALIDTLDAIIVDFSAESER